MHHLNEVPAPHSTPFVNATSKEPLLATRILRKMRGGSQACLIEACDGNAYVTKFTSNPQHRRTLVSEWICTGILQQLEVSCPPVSVIRVTEALLERHRDFHIETNCGPQRLCTGDHFASQYPGSVDRDAVYDWLPATAADLVVNRDDFLGALVFDTWVMQSDRRQAIFVRERKHSGSRPTRRRGLHALMVDHGLAFGGVDWKFRSTTPAELGVCRDFFKGVTGLHNLEPWLSKVEGFPDRVLSNIFASVPAAWLEGDETDLEGVKKRLMERRAVIRAHVRRTCTALRGYLPDWVDPAINLPANQLVGFSRPNPCR